MMKSGTGVVMKSGAGVVMKSGAGVVMKSGAGVVMKSGTGMTSAPGDICGTLGSKSVQRLHCSSHSLGSHQQVSSSS